MASNRHLGRIVALQTLYELDFRREAGDTTFDLGLVLKRNVARYESTVDDVFFIEELVKGVEKHEKALDDELRPLAPEWPLEQIARMDRVVLRMGLYELHYEPDVPPKVVINEAVELAKAFGGDNSSKFINGVLGTALKNKDGQSTETQGEATPEADPLEVKPPEEKTASQVKSAKTPAAAKVKKAAATPTEKPAKPRTKKAA
jgi:N utilization substance protein B